jgi:hypothetical protein
MKISSSLLQLCPEFINTLLVVEWAGAAGQLTPTHTHRPRTTHTLLIVIVHYHEDWCTKKKMHVSDPNTWFIFNLHRELFLF